MHFPLVNMHNFSEYPVNLSVLSQAIWCFFSGTRYSMPEVYRDLVPPLNFAITQQKTRKRL